MALKLLLFASNEDERIFKRFRKESQVVSALDHPNIVKLLEVGEDPEPYFAMEYIQGETLADIVQQKKMDLKELLTMFLKVGEAVHEVHNKGVIHRDIKPDNIMVNKNGEPKIMDFGLARSTQEDSSLTKTGDVVGTPAYMPPEQIGGKQVDYRSDIYSLGATLYEILVKRPPFEGQYFQIMGQIFDTQPIFPKDIDATIPKELDTICMRCLEKKPEKRYQKVKMFIYDLNSFLNRAPKVRLAKKKHIVFNFGFITNSLSLQIALFSLGIFVFLKTFEREGLAILIMLFPLFAIPITGLILQLKRVKKWLIFSCPKWLYFPLLGVSLIALGVLLVLDFHEFIRLKPYQIPLILSGTILTPLLLIILVLRIKAIYKFMFASISILWWGLISMLSVVFALQIFFCLHLEHFFYYIFALSAFSFFSMVIVIHLKENKGAMLRTKFSYRSQIIFALFLFILAFSWAYNRYTISSELNKQITAKIEAFKKQGIITDIS